MRLIPLALLVALIGCGDKDTSDDTGAAVADPDADNDGLPASADCDDGDASVLGETTFYGDADGDGYAGDNLTVDACEAPEGFYDEATDCDDLNADANPAGTEVCDGADNDCDGLTDDLDDDVDTADFNTYYRDKDGDGYGVDDDSKDACDAPSGYVDEGGDCDDDNADLSPETEWNSDIDGDGYGSSGIIVVACEQPVDTTDVGGDCDDLDATINPDATEVCDEIDNDCDELTDDADDSVDLSTGQVWYPDADGDGFPDEDGTSLEACDGGSGYAVPVEEGSDCDDDDSEINPGAEEICSDGIDNNCDGGATGCGVSGDMLGSDAGYTATGATGSYFGYDMDVADVNGDGQDDLITGAYYSSSIGGYAYIKHGPLTGDLSFGSDADATFSGGAAYDYFGKALHASGDVNDDGYNDLVVTCYYCDGDTATSSGTAYLAYGSATGFAAVTDMDSGADVSWSGNSSYDYFGTDANFVGDINGDGIDDLALGAYGDDDNGSTSGSMYLVMGAASGISGGNANDSADTHIVGSGSSDYIGYYRGMPDPIDFDGDGVHDLVMGGYYSSAVNSYGGTLYVHYGGTSAFTSSMDAGDLDAMWGGTSSYDYCGRSVANVGDLDSDGYDDLAVGCDGADPVSSSEGVAYVIPGSSTQYSGAADIDLDAVATIEGDSSSDYLGNGVGGLGDVDDDGVPDMAVSADGYEDSTTGLYSVGATYVFNGPVSGSFAASDADAIIAGEASYEYMGDVIRGGDMDGDGLDDAVLSGWGEDKIYIFGGGGL